jgi:hypothetical protein
MPPKSTKGAVFAALMVGVMAIVVKIILVERFAELRF